MSDFWIVFGTVGIQVIRPAVFDDEDAAAEHYERMDREVMRLDNGVTHLSVHKVRAEDGRMER